MCGRFTSTATTDELMRRFGVTILQNLRPRWNIAPSQNSMVLVRDGLHLQAKTAAWGLPPTGPNKSFLINARMETVREKQTFRDAFPCHAALWWQAAGMNGQRQKPLGIFSYLMAVLWRWPDYCFSRDRNRAL